MSDKKPLMLNADGYVLLLRNELTRLLTIESRARHKLAQLRAMTADAGKERRLAHIEALEFVVGDAPEAPGVEP